MAFIDGRKHKSKVDGICARCGGAISIGDEISWARSATRAVWHKHCAGLPLVGSGGSAPSPATLAASPGECFLAEPPPEPPAPLDAWRYSPEPPTFDPESGERITGVAEDWQRDDASLPWQIVRCHHCNDPIATRDPQRHDTCDSCGYRIRDEFYERRKSDIRRASNRLINPFASSGDLFHEVGSLPSLSPSRRR